MYINKMLEFVKTFSAILWGMAWVIMLIFYKDPVPEDESGAALADTTAVPSVTDSLLQIQEIHSETNMDQAPEQLTANSGERQSFKKNLEHFFLKNLFCYFSKNF